MAVKRKKKQYKRTYLTWGIHQEQTVRYNHSTTLYEIREGNRLINIHANEIDDLVIRILQLKQKVSA